MNLSQDKEKLNEIYEANLTSNYNTNLLMIYLAIDRIATSLDHIATALESIDNKYPTYPENLARG